jgi:hypothetical protein
MERLAADCGDRFRPHAGWSELQGRAES